MSDTAIRIAGLGKQYRIGGPAGSYRTIRETLVGLPARPLRALRSRSNRAHTDESFWALRDLTFEIKRGEATGIIGRNGAGKSTLLKILSRITDPTTGYAEVHGRVGSLLEVGTGFHAELTGRENIFLNGAVLGMKRNEIKARFDEIVAFAEVEAFLDTPVKRYSSGMYMRLAFSVAAHLEPEILVVDEVLAVGDMEFQKRCLGRMSEVAGEGRTVLFVSHNMAAVTRLCRQAVLLDAGRISAIGAAPEIVGAYWQGEHTNAAERVWNHRAAAPGNDAVRLLGVRVVDENLNVYPVVDIRHPILVEMEYEVLEEGHILVPSFQFHTESGVCAFVVHEFNSKWRRTPRPRGRVRSLVEIPGNFLAEGIYSVTAVLGTYVPFSVHFYEEGVVIFQVKDSPDGDSARGDWAGPLAGVVRPVFPWRTYAENSRSGLGDAE